MTQSIIGMMFFGGLILAMGAICVNASRDVPITDCVSRRIRQQIEGLCMEPGSFLSCASFYERRSNHQAQRAWCEQYGLGR